MGLGEGWGPIPALSLSPFLAPSHLCTCAERRRRRLAATNFGEHAIVAALTRKRSDYAIRIGHPRSLTRGKRAATATNHWGWFQENQRDPLLQRASCWFF